MPNKLNLSTPEMPDSGPGSDHFPSRVRDDLQTISETVERRGTAFPTDPALLSDGDKFYRTDQQTTYEYHAPTASWVALAQGVITDPTVGLTAHRTAAVLDHPDASITTLKLGDGQVTAAKLADAAATDPKVGTRTVNQATAAADTGLLGPLLSGIANRIKAITGGGDWKTAPPTTLTAAKAHSDAPAPHTGHETPSGAQTKITSHDSAAGAHATAISAHNASGAAHAAAIGVHNTALGAHGVYFGTGGAPVGTGYAVGSLYRDQTNGNLYEYRAGGVGWRRVGMSIKSIQRVALSLPSGNASGTITISGVDTTKAILGHMGVSAGGTGGNQDSSTMVTVGMFLLSATQVQVERANTGSALTVFAQVVEWE